MPTSYKTPGVYLVEKDAFPGSVVEVATAIPAFIGYTEKAEYNGKDLTNKPFRITSFAEFLNIFGGAPSVRFTYGAASEAKAASDDAEGESEAKGGEQKAALQTKPMFRLYDSMRIFFQNGGAACYICSVGGYDKEIDKEQLVNGITPFVKEQEPTIMLVPDAVSLANADDCASVHNALLAHCNKMQNRFTILDVFDGYKAPLECIGAFREKVTSFLKYGAAYYPWINTNIVSPNEVSFVNIEPEADGEGSYATLALDLAKSVVPGIESLDLSDDEKAKLSKKEVELVSFFKKLSDFDVKKDDSTDLHNTLKVVCPKYAAMMNTMSEMLNLMAPSAAIAGIYARVDNNEGVWKAPANVGVNGVVSPTVNLTNDEQEDLNVPLNGKAINAIRYFVGDGIKVWGARTLDGNSLDWRYVNVRRTMIMLEESIKQASKAYVFDANTSTTWLTMKNMIGNFLYGIWKRGGLAGSVPEDAYEVHVGLGDTMTPEDILEGILRVTVKVALIRPAEFIELTFQQQQQKS